MPNSTLVQPLFEGPIDIVADVHGESVALDHLLRQLGYGPNGKHPDRRRLVFLGDLVDRGPDTPAVLRRVHGLVEQGQAQCLLGNHELNIFLERAKPDNAWFFGQALPTDVELGPQQPADKQLQKLAMDFFAQMPLALERIGLRIVHACWHPVMIELVRHETDVKEVYHRYKKVLSESLKRRQITDEVSQELAEQNENPVKVLTSGLEKPAPQRYLLNHKWRVLSRVSWWNENADQSWCVIGHYSRRQRPFDGGGDSLLGDPDPAGTRQYAPLGTGRVLCIDYSAGYRWQERKALDFNGTFHGKLAALRYPEMVLLFEDGTTAAVLS